MNRAPLRIPAIAGTAVSTTLLLLACAGPRRQPVAPEPFVFRSLDLRQQTSKGEPAWELTSPEARYDLKQRRAQARQPRGIVYRDGKPYISVRADQAAVIADGRSIDLSGAVAIAFLGPKPMQISGARVRWIPGENLMLIDGQPMARDRHSRISATRARYRLDRDLVELRGTTVLQQGPTAAAGSAERARPRLELRTSGLDWRPDQGDLRALAAVQGSRQAGGQPSEALQLKASGLRGNLRQGVVDLLAPVLVNNRRGDTWLQAQQLRWSIPGQWLHSDQPFRAANRAMRLRGDALHVDLQRQLVLVEAGCHLQQPGETLEAARCSWSWPSGSFEAIGAVELRRQALGQTTRAGTLSGRIGDRGEAVFQAPGSRVNSQLRLPAPNPAQQKRSRPPVVF